MKTFIALLAIATLLNPVSLPASDTRPHSLSRPNVLLIVADDLGFTDVGFMGGEIRTPNLDSLAGNGLILSNFYTAPTCSPTRAMLLSGTDNHVAGLGAMFEALTPSLRGKPGYEGFLNRRVVSIASLLQDAGYHTYMAGKWHLGLGPTQTPDQRGFEQSFALLPGAASHFGDARGVIEQAPIARYIENGKQVSLPDNFYSSTFYTDKLIDYIGDNSHDGRPFLAYAAYTAPHWPLHVPDEYLNRYRGKYDLGYDILKKTRFESLASLGLVSADAMPGDSLRDLPAWSDLSTSAQKAESRKMEIYAAMVEHLDAEIGRLIEFLKEQGLLDSTVVVFLSDNGASGEDVGELLQNPSWIDSNFNNEFANFGRPGSFIWTGPGWAQASSTPGRLFKGFATEGGIRVPAFVLAPVNSAPGQIIDIPLSVTDIAPTLLDLAGVKHPGNDYKGKQVWPITGDSIVPLLTGSTNQALQTRSIARELHGQAGLRRGEWKLLRVQPPEGSGGWQLFNLTSDPGETKDLSLEHPDVLKLLLVEWNQFIAENSVLPYP